MCVAPSTCTYLLTTSATVPSELTWLPIFSTLHFSRQSVRSGCWLNSLGRRSRPLALAFVLYNYTAGPTEVDWFCGAGMSTAGQVSTGLLTATFRRDHTMCSSRSMPKDDSGQCLPCPSKEVCAEGEGPGKDTVGRKVYMYTCTCNNLSI